MGVRTAVALFTYNRPWHTRQVLDGLRRNQIEELHVFQDGLRQGDPAQPHRQVGGLIENINFCRTSIVRRPENLGLARSIISGVTGLLQSHQAIVVLEDDCVPSSVFLAYMREMLERLRENPRVFSISGYGLPEFPADYPYDVCFAPLSSSWGWATWADRWRKFDPEARGWEEVLRDRASRRAFEAPGSIFSRLLEMQMAGKIDSWGIRWYFSLFKNRGVCAWPKHSYIQNIGLDGSGVHRDRTDAFHVPLCDEFAGARLRLPPDLEFDPRIQAVFRRRWDAPPRWRTVSRILEPATWARLGSRVWRKMK